MAHRCYIPTTLTALAHGLAHATAIAPDASAETLKGEELEEREYEAMLIAADLAATQALETGGASPRAVVAYDAPEATARRAVAPGVDLLTLTEVAMDAVASVHLDEAEVWDEAVASGDVEAARARLSDSDLLWYDRSELDELLRDRG